MSWEIALMFIQVKPDLVEDIARIHKPQLNGNSAQLR